MKKTLKYLGLFLLWNLAISVAAFLLPPTRAVPVVLALYLITVIWLMTGTEPRTARRRALLRLRPLTGAALRWSIAAVPALILLAWAVESLYVQIVPVPLETLDPLGPLMQTREGALIVALLAVGIAPVVEEVFFRGFIQRTLELRMGAARGIVVASLIFAAVHVLPWVLPLHFFLGLAFGFAVYATRSLWAGILLHAANNSVALLGLSMMGGDLSTAPTIWETGVTGDVMLSLLYVVATSAVALWVARRLWWAGRGARTFPSHADSINAHRVAPSNPDSLEGG